MSSSNALASSWSCARCSGDIEFSSCCICAICCAICSRSSSSVCGLPGKKSPKRSMNPSKSGSSPRSRCSSMWLSSASMSFMRASCSGDISDRPCCSWLNSESRSCLFSSSINSSKRWRAASSIQSYCCSSPTRPARSGGSCSSSWRRCCARSSSSSSRRLSPDERASSTRRSMPSRSCSTISSSWRAMSS